jgi:transketolase
LQYVVLNDLGIIKDEDLKNYSSKRSLLGVHPDYGTPGIEASTGSLGHGLAIAAGMAFASSKKDLIYVLLSDGELQEGSVWEAAMSAAHLKLDNFCWIIDNNDCQIDGRVKDIMSVYPIVDKCVAFGFDVVEIDNYSRFSVQRSFVIDRVGDSVSAMKTAKALGIADSLRVLSRCACGR